MNTDYVGQPLTRRDGPLKVSGGATYSADLHPPGLAYAVAVGSTVGRGLVAAVDTASVEKMPGVLKVLTHKTVMRLKQIPPFNMGGSLGEKRNPLQDDVIYHAGQIVAVVVGDTLEHAQAGADSLRIRYDALAPVTHLDKGVKAPASSFTSKYPIERGKAQERLKGCEVTLDVNYKTPHEHHHPIETHATTAVWEGEKLTVYDATQNNFGIRKGLAMAFGIPNSQVRVLCKFIGGAFGCKGAMWSHVALAAAAAKMVGRPVRLQLTRPQMVTLVGHRALTEQRVALGADKQGKILAAVHEGRNSTSTISDFTEPFTITTPMLYNIPNVFCNQHVVRVNEGTPTYMRAPGESPGTFAFECALDELAAQIGLDPIELRLRNYAETDPSDGKPWSSKSLRECYAKGAERIGWSQRSAQPGAHRDGDWLVGLGMATATYPAVHFPATCAARVLADGRLQFRTGTHEMGTGTATVMAQLGAEIMEYPLEKTEFELGDTDLPVAPVSGGSATTGSVGTALHEAAAELRKKLTALGATTLELPVAGTECKGGFVFATADPKRRISWSELAKSAGGMVEALADIKQFGSPAHSKHSFGAQFAEVRVDPDLGIVRVSRFVGVYGCGRILNHKTAASQMRGGITMGLGMALMEESVMDKASGRWLSPNLAGYHVPTNADVPAIEVILLDEHDPHVNAVGTKGIGEIGITGVAAAVVNAIYNATGKRVRELPVVPARLLS